MFSLEYILKINVKLIFESGFNKNINILYKYKLNTITALLRVLIETNTSILLLLNVTMYNNKVSN